MIHKSGLPESFHVVTDQYGTCLVYYYNQIINLLESKYDPDDEGFIKACWLYDLKSSPQDPDDFDDISIPYDPSDIYSPFVTNNGEYLVLDDDQADDALRILLFDGEGVWAFKSSFLAEYTDMPEEVFKALQEKCEDGNDAILRIIEGSCGRDAFFEAVKDDGGRAYIIGRYGEVEEESGEFFVYRID